jgi:hypothetical protein
MLRASSDVTMLMYEDSVVTSQIKYNELVYVKTKRCESNTSQGLVGRLVGGDGNSGAASVAASPDG